MGETLTPDRLRNWLAGEDRAALLAAFGDLHPADAAEHLAALGPEEIGRYIELLGPKNALETFEFVPFELQKETLAHLRRNALAELINEMSPDDRADLVEELDEEFQERILSLLMQKERQNLLKLLNYPEDSAGAYMTTDYARLSPEDTVQAALSQLRLQAPMWETIYYVYVVDQARRLIGLVSLRDLIVARPGSRVGDVMERNVISARVDEDIEEVAREISHYDFLAMPVVDEAQRLVGIITYDDVFDVIAEEATEDMYRLANLDTDEKVASPLPRSVKLRVPWLLTNLVTALMVALTVHAFSETIQQVVALASLMTVVAMLGGSAGNQSLTVVVRAMALGEIELGRNWRVMIKEVGVGFCNGLICGLVMGLIAFLWHGSLWLGLIIWGAMTANLVIAGLFGATVPITLRRLKLDPALGSSIFVTAATDVGGFCIFLGLATLMLHHLVG